MGGTLHYIKSGTTGHTFKGEEKDENGNVLYETITKEETENVFKVYGHDNLNRLVSEQRDTIEINDIIYQSSSGSSLDILLKYGYMNKQY